MKKLGILLALLLCLCGCAGQQMLEAEFFAMDTVIWFQIDGSQEALEQAKAEILRLDRLLSIEETGSEIVRLNRGESRSLSEETAALLEQALDISRATGGAYDCTIQPVAALWGWYGDTPAVPPQEALDAAMSLVGYDAVTLDGGSIAFAADGMGIDLGGIGKGYAAGRAAQVLRDAGVTSACLSLGGNIRAIGAKPDGSAWTIGIADPEAPASYLATLSVTDCAVVTSGGYNRYFEEDGRRWHHILDPRTGYSADSGLGSVTIVAQDDALADGLSTALFVMGLEDACQFWRDGVYDFEAVLITDEGTIFVTEGLEDRFSCDSAYELVTRASGA